LAARGPSNENLTIDIALIGPSSPRRVLVHSSGIHGVEGFAGAAIQLQILNALPRVAADTALVFTHILNPFGMAWLRRANENNVDLNRNFLPDGRYIGAPPKYEPLDSYLNPKTGPGHDFFYFKAVMAFARHGVATTIQTVAGGQYEFPRNLFFGGKQLQPGLQKYHEFLKDKLWSARRAIGIDVHTGIGRFAKDLLIVEEDYASARKIFGSRVTSAQPKRLPAYRIRGGHHELFSDALSQAERYFVTQEFGTYNPLRVFHALREENRWHQFAAGTLDHETKRALKEIFCPRSKTWRGRVLSRGRTVFEQALRELA
jgi:hypothetical protein